MDKPDELSWNDIIQAVNLFFEAHPGTTYKVCEGCDTMVPEHCGHCPHCHGYRFAPIESSQPQS